MHYCTAAEMLQTLLPTSPVCVGDKTSTIAGFQDLNQEAWAVLDFFSWGGGGQRGSGGFTLGPGGTGPPKSVPGPPPKFFEILLLC